MRAAAVAAVIHPSASERVAADGLGPDDPVGGSEQVDVERARPLLNQFGGWVVVHPIHRTPYPAPEGWVSDRNRGAAADLSP